MVHLLRRFARDDGAEIDNVLEHEAGLRSLADACRLLGMDEPALLALIDGGGLPNAYQTESGRWRIPLDDIRRQLTDATARDRPGTAGEAEAGVLVRHRRPFDPVESRPPVWLAPAERRTFIVNQLMATRFVRITQLSAELGVSQMTIRRDLIRLQNDGLLVRTRGGAMAAEGALPHAPLLPGPFPRSGS